MEERIPVFAEEEGACRSTVIRKSSLWIERMERMVKYPARPAEMIEYRFDYGQQIPVGPHHIKGFSIDSIGFAGVIDEHPFTMPEEDEIPDILDHRAFMRPAIDEDGEASFGAARHEDSLTGSEKIIYREAPMAGSDPVWEHRAPRRAWYQYPAGIEVMLKCSSDEAEALCIAWKVLNATPKMVKEFRRWIDKSGVTKGVRYFSDMAKEMLAVEFMIDEEGREPAPVDPYESDPIYFHPFDDARDGSYELSFEDGEPVKVIKEPVRWEDRQPPKVKGLIESIRNAGSLRTLKGYGEKIRSMHDSAQPVQVKVLWSEYRLRKTALMNRFPMRSKARKIIERIPNAKKGTVSSWLHSNACDFNQRELDEAWSVWRGKAPEQPVEVPQAHRRHRKDCCGDTDCPSCRKTACNIAVLR